MKRVCASNPVLAQKLLRYDPEIGRDARSPLGRIHQLRHSVRSPEVSLCALTFRSAGGHGDRQGLMVCHNHRSNVIRGVLNRI